MRKQIWLAGFAALVLAMICAGTSLAEFIPASEPGQQIGYQAVVLCETLTLREKPDMSSKAVQTLHYGDLPIIVGADSEKGAQRENGFVYCVLGDSEDSPSGWISEDYIFINPAWYVTEKNTAVYAWNDTDAPKVALLEGDMRLPVLKEDGDWYVVSLRGAVGWIHK